MTHETILEKRREEKRREEKRREEKRREEKRSLSWLSFLSVLVSILVLLGSSPISLLAEGIDPVEAFYSVDESLSFSADAVITSSWDSHANIDLTFTNCGEDTIHNWFLIFDLPYVIENIWNATVVSHQEKVYSVTNVGWNQDIPVGGSVTIGFTAASTDGSEVTVMPTLFLLNTKKIEVDTDSGSLYYQEYSAWGSGFTGALTLSHSLEHALTDWSVSFKCNRPINTVNNGVLSQSDDGAYQIINDGNDQNVEVGATRLIGIQGGAADAQVSFELSDVHVSMWKQAFSLTEDKNENGVADYLDFIAGDDPDPDPDIDLETDTDGDGIPDCYEEELGTDPLNMDTDSDGIDDFTEYFCGLDPLISDLNEDFDSDGLTLQQEQALGTEFWNEDTDSDGLSDGDEVNLYGTDPLQEDTDGDGLLDGEEILLGKDPLSVDSDGDGIPDNEDRQAQQTTFTVQNDEDPGISAIVLEMDLAHAIDNVVRIEDVYNIDLFSTGIESRIGSPISLECEESFENATVVFRYDESALGTSEEQDLGVLWYDEENNIYVIQEQAVIDETENTVTLELEHFSTYVLVNLKKWLENASAMIEYDNMNSGTGVPYSYADETYSYIFMVEDSAYFTESQRLQSLEIMRDFVSHMRPGEQMTVGRVYDTYAYGWDSMTEDKALMNSALNYFVGPDFVPMISTGVSYAYDVTAAIRFFESHNTNYNDGNVPVMILITTYTSMVYNPEMFSIANEFGGRVFAINIADPMFTNGGFDVTLSELITGTGGVPLKGSTSEMMWGNYINPPEGEPTEDRTDSDGDGLYDWMETGGMKGFNGRTYNSDPNISDTDGDGITDGDEMGTYRQIEKTAVDGKIVIRFDGAILSEHATSIYRDFIPQAIGINYVFDICSNPQVVDTDGDGYSDHKDPRPSRCDVFYTEIKNSNYVPVRGVWDSINNVTPISYGGNQGWFSSTEAPGKHIFWRGCGVIALCDFLLYKAIQNPAYVTEATEIAYVNQKIEKASYMEYILWMCSQYSGYPVLMGLTGPAIVSALNLYAGEYGRDYRATWKSSLSYDGMLNKIEEMLNKDIPVIFSIGPNTPNMLWGDKEVNIYNRICNGDPGYNPSLNELYQYQKFDATGGHYMVITGVICDKVAGNTMLCISSWGEKLYVDYEEYRDYVENVGGTITSSLVYIT